jgi:hypothetical protein
MKDLFHDLTRNPVGLAGAALTTASGVLILALVAAGVLGLGGGPYGGLIAFLVLPAFFVLGLLLMPLGAWLERRKAREAAEHGERPAELPVVDLNLPRTRRLLLTFGAITVANVVILAMASYKAVQVMDRPAFCGACHSVMDPEFTAYRRSPHARVPCVECHIGAGASWFVKSKLSGTWQLVSVALDLYPRPIPVPVHDLRPARDTCEECHWPSKLIGDRLKIVTRHADDAQSTDLRTALLLRVGGGAGARAKGIHWHVAPGVEIRYLADPGRTRIGAVELRLPDGTSRTYRASDGPSASAPDASWRVMDCIDCHNRPTHVFRSAADEVDQAIEEGRIDRALPFARREALAALQAARGSHGDAAAGIRRSLLEFYEKLDPAGFPGRRPAIEAAAAEVARLYAYNVWPSMNITWGTYPSFLGHDAAPGCWRCHDDAHATEDGRKISQDCDLCHSILAQDEKAPKILEDLGY